MTEAIVSSRDYRQTSAMVREARERGIDPTKQGWMARLMAARKKAAKV